MEKIIMPHLGILVTTYCNLNCRDCADLIPKRKKCHYELDDIICDMNIILDKVDEIGEVLIIGGECFMYPQLNEVIAFCRGKEKIGRIIITTNGTIIPNEKMLNVIKENNVMVRISGYPDNIAPNRNELIRTLGNMQIAVHDLHNMQWLTMGNNSKRYLTEEELAKVFSSCVMKDCVTLSKGIITYCSRQLSAYEQFHYPKPEIREYVCVRDNPHLKEDLNAFYSLPYISTCDYCDGLSCKTKEYVPTAIQILNKQIFLGFVQCYYQLLNLIQTFEYNELEYDDLVRDIMHLFLLDEDSLIGIDEALGLISVIQSENSISDIDKNELLKNLCKLINHLSNDYTFSLIGESELLKLHHVEGVPNIIYVSEIVKEGVDLIISEEDILEQSKRKYNIDVFYYNQLFVRSKLARLESEQIKSVVCGLSYTQYGVLETEMNRNTVNISITGEDIPYSLLFAKEAMKRCKDLDTIVVPFTYYQGYYDISLDRAEIHRLVMNKINIPLLSKPRNDTINYYSGEYLQMFDQFADLSQYVIERDQEWINSLKDKEFFNDILRMPECGSLQFYFNDLSESEKYESAKITAELNERIVTDRGYREVVYALDSFLSELPEHINVIFFVPPMTKYLYQGYSDLLKQNFYNDILPHLEQNSNVYFYDWANHENFCDEDFADFEHLNLKGAKKLTALLNDVINNIIKK